MTRFSSWSSGTAAFLVFGMTAGAVAPIVISAPAKAATFSDINNHWARPFIEGLAQSKIINGFSDGTFRPNQPVSRAEFAALIQALNVQENRPRRTFNDVPNKYWAKSAIEKAYATGFMSGFSNGTFRPDEKMTKVQALVSLASGLRLKNNGDTQTVLSVYRDSNDIPNYAVDQVAAATTKSLVVNYPIVNQLKPNQLLTRGDLAAFIYQSKVNFGDFQPLDSQSAASSYIVGSASKDNQSLTLKIPKGSQINVSYPSFPRVVVTPDETLNMTLTVANDIKNSQGNVLIPKNSKIEGQLIPRYSGNDVLGTQFVTQRIIIGNDSYNDLNATSSLITAQQSSNVSGQSWREAAMTTAAQAIIARVSGRKVNFGDLLTSVLTGQVVNNQPQGKDKLIVIEPQKDLTLTVGSDFYVNALASAQVQ